VAGSGTRAASWLLDLLTASGPGLDVIVGRGFAEPEALEARCAAGAHRLFRQGSAEVLEPFRDAVEERLHEDRATLGSREDQVVLEAPDRAGGS